MKKPQKKAVILAALPQISLAHIRAIAITAEHYRIMTASVQVQMKKYEEDMGGVK